MEVNNILIMFISKFYHLKNDRLILYGLKNANDFSIEWNTILPKTFRSKWKKEIVKF